jgi:hypothetical protein
MTAASAAREAPVLAEFRREIRRLHGCAARFERLVVVPEAPGRARRVVAVFALEGHPALRCFAWAERQATGVTLMAVLRSIDIRGPEEAVRHVAALERTSQERWAQEYA